MKYPSSFFDEIVEESLLSARIVVPLVLNYVHPSSVVDVGCATGAWLSVFRDNGIKTILGLDGACIDPTKLLITPTSYRITDLAKPFYLTEHFDLAISLEVAEHLPSSSANHFVKSLSRLAPIILFSAAVPGQIGLHHINLQWPEYWQHLFDAQNFKMFDPFRSVLWHDDRVAPWYRQNLFLFIHRDILKKKPELSLLPTMKAENGLTLVASYILHANMGLSASLKRLPKLILQKVMKTLRRFCYVH